MANYLSSTLLENDTTTPEEKLWRAVLNQAITDTFGVNTIWICDHEKRDVDNFFTKRTEEFDDICDLANVDPTRLWRKIQRLKGVQAGFLIPLNKEKNVLSFFEKFKEKRKKYVQSHWRYDHVR